MSPVHSGQKLNVQMLCTGIPSAHVQRSGQRSALKHKRQHKEEAYKTSSSPAAVQLTFSFVMDTAGLAHGPGFCRNVRGAFGVDVLEWYGVMSGIAAPILNSCVVEASQGISGSAFNTIVPKQSASISLDLTVTTTYFRSCTPQLQEECSQLGASRLVYRNRTRDGADGCG